MDESVSECADDLAYFQTGDIAPRIPAEARYLVWCMRFASQETYKSREPVASKLPLFKQNTGRPIYLVFLSSLLVLELYIQHIDTEFTFVLVTMRSLNYLSLAFGLLATSCMASDTDTIPASKGRSPDPSHKWIKRQDNTTEYLIYPKDPADSKAVSQTEANIKKITESSSLLSYTDNQDALRMWTINVTDTQLSAVKQDSGVGETVENIVEWEGGAAMPLPSTEARLSNVKPGKVKRDLVYATQSSAVQDLVMPSQPT